MAQNSIMETIRLTTGSPTTDFVFTQKMSSHLIDVLGTTGVYGKFDGTANAGSGCFFIPGGESRAFDVLCGSISIAPSGADATPEVQVIGVG
jgi:hypothetical protein